MKKRLKILWVIAFCSIFFFVEEILEFFLINDVRSYTRVMMHEMYTQEENIDILFVGSSHCYRSFDTAITDEVFGCNTFNAGTSSQGMDGSLQIIKEASRKNEIKQIYLEIYYVMALQPDYKERDLMTSTYIISDYMRPSLQKVSYLLQASGKEHYINSFVPIRRNWQKILEPKDMLNLARLKLSDDYRDYTYTYLTAETEAYKGKGYVATNLSINDDIIISSATIDQANCAKISPDWEKSLKEIIEYCEKEDIKLTLVSTPMPDMRLMGSGDYDAYINYVNDLIEGTDVEYYDFNLCKVEYFSDSIEWFYDTHHLNYKGAEKFSRVFSEFFIGNISEEELFYEMYEEKKDNMPDGIMGVIAINDVSNHCVIIEPITNVNLEYISYDVRRGENLQDSTLVENTDEGIRVYYEEGETGIMSIGLALKEGEKSYINVRYGAE